MDIPHEMAFAWKMSQLPARQPQCWSCKTRGWSTNIFRASKNFFNPINF
jgi:hypothetical protein